MGDRGKRVEVGLTVGCLDMAPEAGKIQILTGFRRELNLDTDVPLAWGKPAALEAIERDALVEAAVHNHAVFGHLLVRVARFHEGIAHGLGDDLGPVPGMAAGFNDLDERVDSRLATWASVMVEVGSDLCGVADVAGVRHRGYRDPWDLPWSVMVKFITFTPSDALEKSRRAST